MDNYFVTLGGSPQKEERICKKSPHLARQPRDPDRRTLLKVLSDRPTRGGPALRGLVWRAGQLRFG